MGLGPALRSLVDCFSVTIDVWVMSGADHYCNDRFEELTCAVKEYFTRGAGAAPFRDPAST
jgi:hypothetical protein